MKKDSKAQNPSDSNNQSRQNDNIHGIIGAIIGDISGSSMEKWKRRAIPRNYTFFNPSSGSITDDSVLTVAVADALLHQKPYRDTLVEWGKKYPRAGYGRGFEKWLRHPEIQGDSFGNGAAMRVSAVGFRCNSLENVLETAKESAVPTHSHKKGIRGAQAVAVSIYLARTGSSKEDIRKYVEKKFKYNLDLTDDDILKMRSHQPKGGYNWAETTVPIAIIAFLNGTDFEDVVRTAVCYGIDTDTIGAMAGSIASAFYGVPKELAEQAATYIPKDMLDIVNECDDSNLPNHRVIPAKYGRWGDNCIMVFGSNSDNTFGEIGSSDTKVYPYHWNPFKGFNIRTIDVSLEETKQDVERLIAEVNQNPNNLYLVQNVGLGDSQIGMETMAPLLRPLADKENVYLYKEYREYFNSEAE